MIESSDPTSVAFVFEGWEGYHRSIVTAISELAPEHLAFRAAPDMRSVRELTWHIAAGRIDWFHRMGAPGASELWQHVLRDGPTLRVELVEWLEKSWDLVEKTIAKWSVDDLTVSFRQPYQGKVYAVSRQWVLWRVMSHDIHHGGQLSMLLAIQGIVPTNLTLLGGHLTDPPEAI